MTKFLTGAPSKGKLPQCCECGEPIRVEQEMEGIVQYVTRDGEKKPIHEDCRYDGIESVGRISPHGGCHGLEVDDESTTHGAVEDGLIFNAKSR